MSDTAIRPSKYERQARIYRALANAKRLALLHALSRGERSVDALAKALLLPKANVSQHLAALRHAGLVKSRKEAARVYYRLSDQGVLKTGP